jgi:hypothetical protein
MHHSSVISKTSVEVLSTGSGLPGLRVVLLALVLSAATMAGVDGYWRAEGYRPNVADSKDLWYFWRQRVYRDDGKVIVFLGTSRILADISLETMDDCLPEYRTIQLGLNGAESCIGLLKGLAEDSAFRGIVVCELDTPLLDRSLWLAHEDYQSYQPPSFAEYLSVIANAFLVEHCMVLRREFSIREVICRYLAPRSRWVPDAICTSFHRETQWLFGKLPDLEGLRLSTTVEYQRTYARRRFPPFRSLAHDIRDIDAMVRVLKARGGNVVFLRAPSSGHRWQLEEHYHPKASNWDNLAKATGACCIHFWDYAPMRCLQCPDESHLDVSDAQRFTRLLARELVCCGAVDDKTK